MQALRAIVIMALYLWLASYAMLYGDIWDSQANPKVNITVGFDSGEIVRGELKRTWSKEWEITDAAGTHRVFKDFAMMSFPAPTEPFDFWKHWRAHLPFYALAYLAMGAILWEPAMQARRWAATRFRGSETHQGQEQ